MCLITAQKQAIVAQEDFIVYKWLRVIDEDTLQKIYCAPYQYMEYNLGELYTTTIEEISDDDHFDKVAFDCVDNALLNNLFKDSKGESNWCVAWYNGKEPADLKYFGSGFHAMTTLERAENVSNMYEYRLFECTVPAGSEYYLNPSDLIISDKIIINKQIS
jgi:hypothetical protein